MQDVRKKNLQVFAWLTFFLVLGYVAFSFTDLDQLTSFADDSVSYLIMAQHFSLYSDVSPLIEKAYISERYPPLFPLLLAIVGGAEDFAVAHQLVVVMFLAACMLYGIWATRVLGSHWLGLMACLIYVFSPNIWPMLLRILSEELYLSLTLVVLIIAEPARKQGGLWLITVSLLLASIMLTRITGITLVIAWGIYLLMDRSRESRFPSTWARLSSVVFPFIVAAAWHISRQVNNEEHLYNTELDWLVDRITDNQQPVLELFGYLNTQGSAMIDNWLGALMLVWQPGLNARTVIAMLLLALVVTGWIARIRKNQLDSWYSLFYVGLIFLWPFPGQFYRFIVPILPLFIVYAILATQVVAGKFPKRLTPFMPVMTGLIFFALSSPAIFLIYQRSQYPPENDLDFSTNPEFYQEADIHRARDKARQHLLLAREMELLRTSTPVGTTIMWFTPAYINLLAEREGMPFPNTAGHDAMQLAIKLDPPDYIYISRLHPRKTSVNGLAMFEWVGDVGEIERTTIIPGTNRAFSMMLRNY